MRLSRFFIFTILLLLPVFSHAEVIINEIAWMGTAESSNAEWIELYNTGSADVDLTGWKLYEAGGGTLIISLAKSISAGGYFLIERVTPSVPDSVPGINDVSGSFGGSGLSNSGEHLVLKDSADNTIQTLNFLTGWSAGDVATKKTMQWNGTMWITASSTPGVINASTSSSASTTTDETVTTTSQTADTTASSNQTTHTIISAHSSPAPLSSTENKIEFEVSAGRDRLTAVGNSLIFKAIPTKIQNMPESGIVYLWSFGDGTMAQGNNISHAYKFAGEYTVVVNANYSDKQAVSRMWVEVISPTISINKVSGGIEISNNSSMEINLEGWKLVSQKKIFVFPTDTLIPNNQKVTFADDVTGMLDESTQLLNPLGKEMSYIKKVEVSTANAVLENIQAKIEEVEKKMAQITLPAKNIVTKSIPIPEVVLQPEFKVEKNEEESLASYNVGIGLENTATVFEAEKDTGLVSRLFTWPIKGFNFVRKLFVEE
ncbi:MAG: lamin tail domain-containing protein [Candidatus Paceibacterota bacterium]|jgi:hypothetical protein